MQIMRNSILCFTMVSVMSVQYVQSQSLSFRLPDEAQQKPDESPEPSSKKGDSGITSSDTHAGSESSTEAGATKTQVTEKDQRTADNAPRQSTDKDVTVNNKRHEGPSSPQSNKTEKLRGQSSTGRGILKKGIGIQSGIRFHRPKKFNEFLTDYYNAFIPENLSVPVDKKSIGPGLFLTLNGTIDIGPLFHVTPFAQGMWAGKQFYFRGGLVKDVHINTYTAMGGLNLWVRVLNREKFTLRLGAGGYGAYTIASVTGDISGTRVSGGGFGLKGLLGTELRLNRHLVLTFDCSVPYGGSKIKNKGSLRTPGAPVKYPTRLEHVGFELLPGVMFYF